jgi:hypothetical protein
VVSPSVREREHQKWLPEADGRGALRLVMGVGAFVLSRRLACTSDEGVEMQARPSTATAASELGGWHPDNSTSSASG